MLLYKIFWFHYVMILTKFLSLCMDNVSSFVYIFFLIFLVYNYFNLFLWYLMANTFTSHSFSSVSAFIIKPVYMSLFLSLMTWLCVHMTMFFINVHSSFVSSCLVLVFPVSLKVSLFWYCFWALYFFVFLWRCYFVFYFGKCQKGIACYSKQLYFLLLLNMP